MKIIVPLRPRSTAELEILLPQLDKRVDIVEIWLDVLVQELMFAPGLVPVVQKLLEKTRKDFNVQFLGVCKMPTENGHFPGNKHQRIKVLQQFLQLGGDFVDLDIQENTDEYIELIPSEKLWLSCHDFKTIPKNLLSIKDRMKVFEPAVFKFAVTPEDASQLDKFIDFAKQDADTTIFTTMGERGINGREQLKPYTYGAFYALSPDATTASGQPSLADL